MTHTAQELYRYAMETPEVTRDLERTFNTFMALDMKGVRVETPKAIALLLKNNVRAAAKLYVQTNGLPLEYWRVFPLHEREACADLMLTLYHYGKGGAYND